MEQTVGGQRKIKIQELKEFWQSLKKGRREVLWHPESLESLSASFPPGDTAHESKSIRKCHV